MFERLPHTVGYVTNLSADLALRALTSLRAELNHRMLLMEGRAKDLAEMLQVAPDEAPPSLVIVVDEFATLVKEVPEFVAGIIDVAQRGRSLGIHLVLATQRPSGAVNENILANTNLRISLRMLDRTRVDGRDRQPRGGRHPGAAEGPGVRPARCPAPRAVPERVQRRATSSPSKRRGPVLVGEFDGPHAVPRRAPDGGAAPARSAGAAATTQLDAVIDAIAAADTQRSRCRRRDGRGATRCPTWSSCRAVLADPRDAVAARRHPGGSPRSGCSTRRNVRSRSPLVVDLEDGGGWLVFGSGGSGKTTVLRSLATSLMLSGTPGEVAVLGFDFASRGLDRACAASRT